MILNVLDIAPLHLNATIFFFGIFMVLTIYCYLFVFDYCLLWSTVSLWFWNKPIIIIIIIIIISIIYYWIQDSVFSHARFVPSSI